MKEQKFDSKKDIRPSSVEALADKWGRGWAESKIYQPDLESAKKPFYNLMMFPYPSAEGLHVGNMYAFTGADVYGRYQRMKGKSVFEPIGLDGFGIHSENYALTIGAHPMKQSKKSEERFYNQLHVLGNGFDWRHTVETYKPNYYRWTQWIFTTFFKAGLVVKKKSAVNWCPSCKTVLADEQVVAGKDVGKTRHDVYAIEDDQRTKVCERCGTEVEIRELEQWFFKITDYAEKLLEGLNRIDWSEKVKIAQKNWIGRNEGLLFRAPIKDTKLYIDTFSAHFEAFYADTFVVIAPDHPFLPKLLEGVHNKDEVFKFSKKLIERRKNEQPGEKKEPEGMFTGRYIVDPVGNGDLPIWVANYAIKEYGTGIVKCSAHDERDFAFAKKYNIRLKPVLFPSDPKLRAKVEKLEICYTDMKNGILSEPKEFAGKRAGEVRDQIIKYAQEKGFAKLHTTYHLRDWLISRQRYWGAPIPMIYCESCARKGLSYFTTDEAKKIRNWKLSTQMRDPAEAGEIGNSAHEWAAGWYPVPDEDLPVELPYVENFKPLGIGEAPLAQDPEFVNVKCPHCGSPARRETDVCDTFLDSSWYFLRYPSTDFDTVAFDEKRTKKWLPVNMYVGGAEHSVLHLLYARFVTKVLFDLKLLSFDEPFTKFRAHGLIIKEGAKMSKSKGNVVIPDKYIEKFGTDAIRLYLMFLGPFDQGGDFRDSGMEGMSRFVKRVAKFASYQMEGPSDRFLPIRQAQGSSRELTPRGETNKNLDKIMAKTIKSVTSDLESLSYNTAIARIMEYVNALTKEGKDQKMDHKYVKTLLLVLAPFAPYFTEEAYQQFGEGSIHTAPWPTFDEKQIQEDQLTIPIQINGKLRDTLEIQSSKVKDQRFVEEKAMKSPKVLAHLKGKKVKKTIYIEGKVLNIVV